VSDAPRPEVVSAGAEVLQAAVAYVDARSDNLPLRELNVAYRRLERAVADFHEATRE